MSLLKFWLLRFLFAGTFFFADGASAIAAVDGGGDGGGDSSGDAGDAGGGDSSADSDAGDTGDGGSGDDPDAAVSVDGSDQNAEVSLADGRKIPAKYKELFEHDKDLRSLYFANQALKKTFPGGVKEAIGLARQLEEMGGFEAVEKLQSDLDLYTADAEAFNDGDPKWIEKSFKEDVDLSLKHFTNALGYVATNHPEHYNHLMADVIVKDIEGALPIEQIHGILAALKDNPQAQEAAKQLARYFNARVKMAKEVPQKQGDPLANERTKLDQEKAQVRNDKINTQAAPYLDRTIAGSVGAAAKAAGFDLAKVAKAQPNRYGRFLKDVKNAVHNEILNDTKWLDRYSAVLHSGDTQKAVRMLNARHDLAIKGTDSKAGVASVIFADWFGAPKAGARRGNVDKGDKGDGNNNRPRTFGKETPTLVNALPPAKDIHYSDPLTDKWNGIYRLKTGKLIQVKRP